MPRSRLLSVLPAALVLAGAFPMCQAREWSGELVVTGNSGVTSTEIGGVVGAAACADLDSLCVEKVCAAVAGLYWARGYFDAEVRCVQAAAGDTIVVSVAEGEPSVLEAIRVEGASAGDLPTLDALLAGSKGLPLSQGAMEAGIEGLLTFYDTQGHPLAAVRPEVSRLDAHRMELVLKVDPGPRATLGPVTLRGLRRNKRSAVLAETGLLPGRPYDGTQVDEARERMLRLRVFDAVSEPELAFNPSDTTISVAFDVQEARASLFEGALAYSPNAGGSRVVGSLSLETLSLGGSLRRAKLMWLRWGNDRLSWSLYYREPRLAGRPFALEGTLASDVVDSSYARRRLALAVVYVGEPNLEIGTGGFAGTTKDRTLAGGEGNFTERGLSFRLAHEGRDRPVNPRSGMLLRFEHEVETLHYSDSSASDRTLNNLAVRAQYILGLTRQSRVALGASFTGAFSSSGAVPISHMVRLGGSGSLRGYPDDWFTAERALALSIELRRLLGMDSRIYAFFDAATLESAADSFGDFASGPFGYGVGVQSGSSAGLVRIEIALGRGDDWADAKIHVALAGLF